MRTLPLILLPALLTPTLAAPPSPPSVAPSLRRSVASQPPSPLLPYTTTRTTAALDQAATDLPSAIASANQTLTLLATYGSDRDADAFRQAAFTRRLLLQLKDVPAPVRATLLPYLRAHDDLAKAMAFAVATPDKSKTAYPLLARLIKDRPQIVEKLPNLAAAIAVVHDEPLKRQINENAVHAPDPVALLDFYSANESRMSFGLRAMPVDLLAYVVDTTSSIPDLTWANRSYAGNRNVGELFFNVRYDYNAFTLNRAKDVTKQGYTLPNILKLGGVCADQAYFATEVAKAIGVPSAYTHASDAEVSHAWVGFLQSDGKRVHWNFDSGRYESYRNVRGDVTDPQTRDPIPDSYVTLLAESATADPTTRQTAASYADAALLLLPNPKSAIRNPQSPQLPPELAEAQLSPRPRDVQGALSLLETGLKRCETYAPAWSVVGNLAATGQMTLDQKRRWADLVQKLCGTKYPDFALTIYDPMIRTVEDPVAQSKLWDAVYASVTNRPDLAAQVRIRQGEMWEKSGNLMKAGQAYEDVIKRYVNSTPYALLAVQKAEGILKQINKPDQILPLYKRASAAAMHPDSMMAGEFLKQSNWYKLRAAYAQKLDEAGRTAEARALLPQDPQTTAP